MNTLRQFVKLNTSVKFFLVVLLAAMLALTSAGGFVYAQETTDPPPTTETQTDSDTPSSGVIIADPDTSAPDVSEAPLQTEVATSTEGTGGQSSDTGGTIITNDATASTSVENLLNRTEVNADQPGEEMNSSTLTASSTNSGVLGSAATSTAMTGENAAVGGEGTNLIVTGNAVSTANVINEVNTNIFNSDGLILFLNQLFGHGIDLSTYDLSYFFVGGPGASPTVTDAGEPQCTLLTCLNSSTLNVWNSNDAAVTNSVIVRSSTGDNLATSTGDATIDTGDAYAAANVVNLVNTNIINSSYLLLSYNNFGDLDDNITLPSADFFDQLFATGAATSSMNASTYSVESNNYIELTGTTTATANTGENMASTSLEFLDASSTEPSGSGVVETGDAYAAAHTYNQANTNNVGGTSVFMLFRVSGDWKGRIIGLPDGLIQTTIPDGNDTIIQFVSGNGTTTPTATQLLEEYNSSHFSAISTSSADIENNIDVTADTGNNEALTTYGTSTVNTGNAYASANVINLVNTNIVGQNWIFAVFNIFGDLSGDIVFGGSPILLVGANPSRAELSPGDEVSYTFTVQNTGGADAEEVVVNASYDNTLLTFSGGDVETTITTTGSSWRLGEVEKGETRTFTITGRVGTNFPAGERANVPFTVAAVNDSITSPSTSETVSASIVVSSPSISGGGGGGGGGGGTRSSKAKKDAGPTGMPLMVMTKNANVATTTAPSAVDYKVVIYNKKTGGPIYGAKLTDTLYDPLGGVVYTRSWDLGTLVSGDEIKLTYTVSYATTSVTGVYRNVATVTGKRDSLTGKAIKSFETSAQVYVFGSGEVLGTTTSTILPSSVSIAAACTPLITQTMRPGLGNNPEEVKKLQTFLNQQAAANLPTTGFFGPMTTLAVKQLQARYASEILAPVGLSVPSGLVLTMTMNKINSLACGGMPLAAAQFTTPTPLPQMAATAPSVQKPTPPKPQAPATTKKAPTKPIEAALKPSEEAAAPTPSPVAAPPPEPKKQSGLFGWIAGFF